MINDKNGGHERGCAKKHEVHREIKNAIVDMLTIKREKIIIMKIIHKTQNKRE